MTAKRRHAARKQTIAKGIYIDHRVTCRASYTTRSGARCQCPWKCQVKQADGRYKPVELSARNTRDALEEKTRLQGDGRRTPVGASALFRDFFLNDFLRLRRLALTTERNYRHVYRCYLDGRFGDKSLAEIRREHVLEYAVWLGVEAERRLLTTGKRNEQFIVQAFAPLSSVLNLAVEIGRLAGESPAARVQLPDYPMLDADEEGNALRVLSEAQLAALFDGAAAIGGWRGQRDEMMLRVCAELGLRNAELRGLRLHDFDFEKLTVHIQRQACDYSKEDRLTKGRRCRVLPLAPDFAKMVSEWRQRRFADGATSASYLFVRGGRSGRRTDYAADFVSALTTRTAIRDAQTNAGLVDATGEPLITLHGLRHGCASQLFASTEPRLPLLVISRYLGHSDVRTTERVYAHLLDEDEQMRDCARALAARRV